MIVSCNNKPTVCRAACPWAVARLWLASVLAILAIAASAQEDRLMCRFCKVDTTLTNAELHTLYLAYSKTEAYAASLGSLPSDPLQAVAKRPLSLQALFNAAVEMKHKGKKRRMARFARQMWMLGEMICNEFTGDASCPYRLLYREDECLVLYNWRHIDSIVQVTQKPEYDIVECALPPDWLDYYYFKLLHK